MYSVFSFILLLLYYNKSKGENMNALKETKKKHLLAILKYLYLHNSSTMNELVENLQLSQPSIRNMVRILQEKQMIQEIGNDLSSGGRCPTRFALNEKNYLILCLYIQVDKVIYQVRSFSEIKKEDTLIYQDEEELKKTIKQLVDKNEVHCCQIAVEGIVYEDEYVTDHQNIHKKTSLGERYQKRNRLANSTSK